MLKLSAKFALLLTLLLTVATTTQARTTVGQDEIKFQVMASGSYSSQEKPFLAVARDVTVYQTLRAALAPNLPAQSENYFRSHAVVFAYLGQRRSGGYSVAVVPRAQRLIVLERGPAKGSIVTEALTTPFVVVEVEREHDQELPLAFDTAWQNALTTYRVTQGNFQTTGGFAGIREKFTVTGRLRTLTQGDLVTFVADLQGVRGKQRYQLQSITTALVPRADKVTVPYWHAGGFVQPPENVLGATGKFDRSRKQLTLEFKSLPNNIADDFEGTGRLTARRADKK